MRPSSAAFNTSARKISDLVSTDQHCLEGVATNHALQPGQRIRPDVPDGRAVEFVTPVGDRGAARRVSGRSKGWESHLPGIIASNGD